MRDLLEILDDCYDRSSTLITSQLPIDQWHAYLSDRTIADAILNRVVHNIMTQLLDAAFSHAREASENKKEGSKTTNP